MNESKKYQFYGRRSSRGIKQNHKDMISQYLSKYTLPLEDVANFISNQPITWLEIGFGAGEHLLGQAQENPSAACIGIEPFLNGFFALFKRLVEANIQNVKVLRNDARLVLDVIPESSLDKIFILFADPWPKKRHHKRRLIEESLITRLLGLLKDEGELIIATDHADYQTWILEHMEMVLEKGKNENWDFTYKPVLFPEQKTMWDEPQGWFKTRYQMKAEREGRNSIFLKYVKMKRPRE